MSHQDERPTMPLQGWLEAVILEAKTTDAQSRPFRDTLTRWYWAGEPVWMAAESLRFLVTESARQERIEKMTNDDGMSAIRRARGK